MKSRLALELAFRHAPSRSSAISRAASQRPVPRSHKMRKIPIKKFNRPLSSSAVVPSSLEGDICNNSSYGNHHQNRGNRPIHCETCTCRDNESNNIDNSIVSSQESEQQSFPCGSSQHEDDYATLPPRQSEPVYSVHKRVLPSNLIALSSPQGRKYLMETLQDNSAESYFALTEQFVNQSDPAFCGVTTLLMVCNAMCIDPDVRWRGGWRFYGSEDVLLDRCCLSAERIRRVGISMEEFRLLGQCHGLTIDLKRPMSQEQTRPPTNATAKSLGKELFTLDEFRSDIKRILQQPSGDERGPRDARNSVVVTSFSRTALGQTGDGHFSPLAAFHEATDQVLLLDVARFKYAPYWVSVTSLYCSMIPVDAATGKSRGWFIMHPPSKRCGHLLSREDRRPAEVVPLVGEKNACPVGRVKINFCPANPMENPTNSKR